MERHKAESKRAKPQIKHEKERRREPEKALRSSEHLIQTLIDTIEGEVFVKDRNGKYLYVNRAYGEDFEVDPKGVIGKDDYFVFSPEVAAELQENDKRIMAAKKAEHVEESVFIRGKHRTYLTNKVPLIGEDGNVIGICGVGFDITRHKEIEKALKERTAELKESEERFSLAVSAAGAGIWSLDPQTGKAWYSERFKELLGYSSDESQATFPGWENSLHPDERDSILAAMQNHLDHHTPFNEVCRLQSKSGEYRWYRKMAQALWDEDGQAYRMAGSIIDITEGRLAQDQVVKLSQATEDSPASVVITNKSGKIEYVNTTFCNVTGYSPQEAIGENPRILKSGDLPESFYKNLWETILSGKTWKGDFINKKKNSEELWESASISPIKNNKGEITHFVAVKQDITERKHMEKELIRAKQAADDANKSKGDFLANMSHEIRTPMNAVIGMAHLALKTDLTDKQRDYLKKIQSSANSLLGIINDILDFSKIEAGKMDMESVEFNLEDVMDNLANLITVKAQEKEDIEVLFNTNREVPRFLIGDELRLGQILINLSNNAVKFTDSGEIVVSTELLKRNEEQVTLKFSVSDTGIGLTKAQAGKLFQSFSQADTSTTRKYGGTGLGLTISKRLTEMMGGEIWVESKYGEGSTFIFTANFGLGKERAKRVFKPSKDLRGIRV